MVPIAQGRPALQRRTLPHHSTASPKYRDPLEDARHLASASRKADQLFARGYRSRRLSESLLELTTPRGGTLTVDTKRRRCTCTGWQRYGFCSHLWGYGKLVWDQAKEGLRHA